MKRSMRRVIPALLVAIGVAAATTYAQAPAGRGRGAAPAQPSPAVPAEPLSALAPENLAKPRPKAPFDLTGNWFIAGGVQGWLFGRTPNVLPKLTPAAQKHFDAYAAATKDGKVYRDDIGKCWPAGMPVMMTRVPPPSGCSCQTMRMVPAKAGSSLTNFTSHTRRSLGTSSAKVALTTSVSSVVLPRPACR